MSERIPFLSTVILAAVITILSGCMAGQPPVIEKLDELTLVTVTYSRTPIIMSTDTPFDRVNTRDFVEIGAIEVNRMGAFEYFLWLGISDMQHMASADKHPKEFETITLVVGDVELSLDVRGWTQDTIGTSEPIYEKTFAASADAYYEVSVDDIQLLTEANDIKLRTTASEPKEYVPWYKQSTAKNDLSEFLRTVSQ